VDFKAKMIKKKCFKSSWIVSKHKEINADPILVEKAIYAFELLGNLIFKISINTSFLICQLDFRGSIKNEYTKELREGARRIKSHILGGNYSLLNVKEDASKVACIASLVRDNRLIMDLKKIKLYRKDIDRINGINLSGEFSILNKLKAISPESFYLWAIATKTI